MPLNAPAADATVPFADVRAALGRVLQSASFAHSPQLQRFLTFLVEETLAGRGAHLKEYVIGLEVFARPASYDPRVDSLVRVEARRLRAALASYYSGDGRDDTVVIDLQKGHYVPAFREAARPSPVGAPPAAPGGGEQGQAGVAARSRFAAFRPARLGTILLFVAALAAIAAGAARFLRTSPVQPLTERDAIILAGFANSTNEAIFDETLKQGLATELEQSPFLNIVSDRRVGQIVKMMGRTTSERLDRAHARELCLRAGAKVIVAGSIDRMGSQYVIGLTATDCSTGDDLLHVQQEAARKEAVLRSLSAAASAMRRRLGESLSSVQQFGMKVEDATTSSLEALQAFSLGRKTAREKGSPADVPFYKRAVEIDPDFASAHAALGVSYVNQGQPAAAQEHLEKAYRLRDRVSEREKYRISAYYFQAVTGELEKASEVYELWKQSYPREFAPYVNLGLAHLWLGDYQKALAETREAARLEPGNVLPYTNLAAILIKLERPAEANAVLGQASERALVSTFLRLNLCYLAFLRHDPSVAEGQVAEVRDSPGDRAPLLSMQSDTEAYYGRLASARVLSRRAAESAVRGGGGEAAATWLLNAALREAEFGNAAEARRMVRESVGLSTGRDVLTLAALAAARSGDAASADRLAARLQAAFPLNTVTTKYWLPTIRAASEISRRHPAPARQLLEEATPLELGSPPPLGLATLYPVYLRGEACLAARDAAAAAREFRKLLDHPGLVLNFPLRALSHLQLARAHKMAGDRETAKRAYDDLLALWSDADPDLPMLKQARAERRALQ